MLLIDIDAACKLAHWGMLSQLPALTGIELSACQTLTSLKYRALKASSKLDGRVFHSAEAVQEVLRVVGQMPVLDPGLEILPGLQDVAGIDAGEAVLLSAAAAAKDARLLTGDKRSLRSLGACPPEIRATVAGRILVVEQVLAGALDKRGLQWLREQVCPQRHVDKAVSIIMGSRCDAAEASVREALASYIAEMVSLCDPSLLSPAL